MRPTTLLLAVALFSLACSRKTEPPAKTWYDVAPLLESLRPEERTSAARSAGVASLSELPLYDLSLELEHDLSRFRLSEDVYFTNTSAEPLSEIVLRVYANAVGKEPPVRFEKGSCPDGPECSVASEAPSVIAIKLQKPLGQGERVRARVELSGVLREIDPERTTMLAQGLESLSRMGSNEGAGDYGLLAQSDGVASLANFYAVLARRDGGRWERGEASTMGDLGASGTSHVRLKVETATDIRLVSSGVTTHETPGKSGRQVHVVAALVRDFALLASKKFELSKAKVGPVEVRSHYVASDEKAGKRVLDAAARSLAVYERRFGRYPYTDLDIVEAPLVGGAGGVEFSGLVTVASMLYRPMLAEGPLAMVTQLMGGGGSEQNKQIDTLTDAMIEFVTAHEIAHQYWPGLVGSDSRTHPWADESLAQYSAMLYFEDRYGKERAELEADRQVLSNYHMMRLLGKPDGKVDRPVGKFDSEIGYAGLVYGKGPYFFRELRKLVGDQAFFTALSAHVADHRFKTAAPRAFVERLAKGPKQNEVRALARRWLDEAHGDADLGGPDIRKMLAGWIGPEAAKNLGPELEMVTQLLMRLMGPSDSKSGSGGGLGGLLDLLQDPGKKP